MLIIGTPGWIILSGMACFVLTLVITGIHTIRRSIEVRGTSPICRPLSILGKLSMFTSWGILAAGAAGLLADRIHSAPSTKWIAALLVVDGTVFIVVSFFSLGNANKFGLPTEETKLCTSGIYELSRNPMYVGFYLYCAASCFHVPHPIVIVLASTAIIIHHAIVLAEERFLEKRFEEEWTTYCSSVRRYI